MKRIVLLFSICTLLSLFSAKAFDIKDALKAVGNSTSSQSSQSSSSGLGDILGGIGSLLGKTDVTIEDLAGSWKYVKPAVAFKSDNMLKKAGGAAAAGVIEGKLAPYYQKAGITSMKFTVATDSTFTMKVGVANLTGTLEKDNDGNFIFKFKALGKVNIGQITSVITKSGKNIDVTFDASKLITLVSKIASISGNSTIQGVASLLESYDGMNAGFQLSKE